MMQISLFFLLLTILPVKLLADPPVKRYNSIQITDPNATKETKALYANLKLLAEDHVLFGHQDALAYGVMWKDWHEWRSDVNDVCGKFPAVFGWDVSKLGKYTHNIDTVDFEQMKFWIREVYKRGGINTISWHLDNFLNGGSSWDVGDNVVAAILPGGSHHQEYLDKLDLFAGFISDLKVGFLFKKDIPIIFRPFHEHTGDWFWWGASHCSPEEYKALWRFTVEYLRDEKDLHNLLWAYSPDIFEDQEHYLMCYPGDDYVDILGLDDYHDVGSHGNIEDLARRLGMVVELAQKKGKVAALTETGFNQIPREQWWTDQLLQTIKNDPLASQIAWVLVWRNARFSHHFGPYPSHKTADDFRAFSRDSMMLFKSDLNHSVYRLPK